MKRREFFKASVAVMSVGGISSVGAAPGAESSGGTARQFYELRRYHLRRGPKQKLFGSGTVGRFPVQIVYAIAIRGEYNLAAIGGPDRKLVGP